MQTLSSREVQTQYGQFVDTLQDDIVCVTRHGRPLYWAMNDRHLREKDPSVFIGRMILLRAQLLNQVSPQAEPIDALFAQTDAHLTGSLSESDVMSVVHANRR
jgi:hypothetical protein